MNAFTHPTGCLEAAAGPPSVVGLPSWGWVVGGLRDQYLPLDQLLVALGLLAWALWAYALLVTGLRVVTVVAARRGLVGWTGLPRTPPHTGPSVA